jgi:hypothetical protein
VTTETGGRGEGLEDLLPVPEVAPPALGVERGLQVLFRSRLAVAGRAAPRKLLVVVEVVVALPAVAVVSVSTNP